VGVLEIQSDNFDKYTMFKNIVSNGLKRYWSLNLKNSAFIFLIR